MSKCLHCPWLEEDGVCHGDCVPVKPLKTLNNDITRCNGKSDRDECKDCLRRTAPRPDMVWMVEPCIELPCVMRIDDKPEQMMNGNENRPCIHPVLYL